METRVSELTRSMDRTTLQAIIPGRDYTSRKSGATTTTMKKKKPAKKDEQPRQNVLNWSDMERIVPEWKSYTKEEKTTAFCVNAVYRILSGATPKPHPGISVLQFKPASIEKLVLFSLEGIHLPYVTISRESEQSAKGALDQLIAIDASSADPELKKARMMLPFLLHLHAIFFLAHGKIRVLPEGIGGENPFGEDEHAVMSIAFKSVTEGVIGYLRNKQEGAMERVYGVKDKKGESLIDQIKKDSGDNTNNNT